MAKKVWKNHLLKLSLPYEVNAKKNSNFRQQVSNSRSIDCPQDFFIFLPEHELVKAAKHGRDFLVTPLHAVIPQTFISKNKTHTLINIKVFKVDLTCRWAFLTFTFLGLEGEIVPSGSFLSCMVKVSHCFTHQVTPLCSPYPSSPLYPGRPSKTRVPKCSFLRLHSRKLAPSPVRNTRMARNSPRGEEQQGKWGKGTETSFKNFLS